MVHSVCLHDKILSEVRLNIYSCHKKQTFLEQTLDVKCLLNKWWFGAKKDIFCVFFLTLYVLMDSSFWFDTINLGWSFVYAKGHKL